MTYHLYSSSSSIPLQSFTPIYTQVLTRNTYVLYKTNTSTTVKELLTNKNVSHDATVYNWIIINLFYR